MDDKLEQLFGKTHEQKCLLALGLTEQEIVEYRILGCSIGTADGTANYCCDNIMLSGFDGRRIAVGREEIIKHLDGILVNTAPWESRRSRK